MVSLEGLEPSTSAFAGPRSIQLGYKLIQGSIVKCMVPKERFELSRLFKHYALNVARLPFRHFGTNNHSGVINNPVTILSVKLFSCNTNEWVNGWAERRFQRIIGSDWFFFLPISAFE
jgi:hypothetical protein